MAKAPGMNGTQVRVFDLHCDTPIYLDKHEINHIDPVRLHSQGYLGAVFAHFVGPEVKDPFVAAVKLLSSTIAYMGKEKNMAIIHTHEQVDKQKLNIILGIEGGHIFDNTFEQFKALYKTGIRVFTLTWNNSNQLAYSGLEADKKGLTKKGKEFIKKMNNYDIIIDFSHASTQTVLDVCAITDNQVMASHSCARALNETFLRNISDQAIKAIVEKGGVVGVNFSQYHLGNHGVFDHVDYLVNKFGTDYVAIGSDFDGITDAVIKSPAGLKDLENQLLKKGYKKKDIHKVFSQNFLRLLRKTERTSH